MLCRPCQKDQSKVTLQIPPLQCPFKVLRSEKMKRVWENQQMKGVPFRSKEGICGSVLSRLPSVVV